MRCLRALEAKTRFQYQKLIGWNGSDEYPFGIKQDFVSFSHNNNQLAAEATGKYLVFLNDDCFIRDFAIERMIYILEKNPDVGIVGGKLFFGNGTVQHCGVTFKGLAPVHIHSGKHGTDWIDQDREYQAVTGALMAIRREDFEKLGGFDEQFVNCFEDLDLCFKMRYELKKKVVYCAKAEAVHLESQTRKNSIRPYFSAFCEKWKGKIRDDYHAYQGEYKIWPSVQSEHKISFACCSNNIEKWHALCKSLGQQPITKTNPKDAAKALNECIDEAPGDIIVLCHHDLEFQPSFIETLSELIPAYGEFGVLGIAGKTASGLPVGGCILADGTPWAAVKEGPVVILDECLLIIRKASGLRFDEDFKGFHAYGADLCLQAVAKGLKNYALPLPVCHLSQTGSTDGTYFESLGRLRDKWRDIPVIHLTHAEISQKGIKCLIM